MIRAQFSVDQDHHLTAFTLSGHADSGPYGYDIVCAAVSALAISTVNGLEQVVHDHPQVDQNAEEGGYLSVEHISAGHDAQIIMQTFLNGLADIADNYSKFLSIKMNQVHSGGEQS